MEVERPHEIAINGKTNNIDLYRRGINNVNGFSSITAIDTLLLGYNKLEHVKGLKSITNVK